MQRSTLRSDQSDGQHASDRLRRVDAGAARKGGVARNWLTSNIMFNCCTAAVELATRYSTSHTDIMHYEWGSETRFSSQKTMRNSVHTYK